MTKAAQLVLEAALKLTAEEQDELIRGLLGFSHGADKDLATDEETLTDEWKAELDRRIAHMDAHPDDWVSPEEAVRRAKEMQKNKTAG